MSKPDRFSLKAIKIRPDLIRKIRNFTRYFLLLVLFGVYIHACLVTYKQDTKPDLEAERHERQWNDERYHVNWDIIEFTRSGYTELAVDLINSGIDPGEVIEWQRYSLLMEAALSFNPEIVNALLDAGADYDGRDEDGSTPLMVACQFDDPECVSILLEAGADPNAINADGTTPLKLAATNANLECIRLLLDAGADPDFQGNHFITALAIACCPNGAPRVYWNPQEMSHVCVDFLSDEYQVRERQFKLDYAESHIPVVELLLDAGADINLCPSLYIQPLRLAVGTRNLNLIRLLLENGSDPLERVPSEALGYYETFDVLKLLLEFDAIADYLDWRRGYHPLEKFAETNDIDGVGLVLGNDWIRIRSENYSGAFDIAVENGNLDALTVIWEHYRDKFPDFIPYSCITDETPLITAVRFNQNEIVAYLLSNGSDPDIPQIYVEGIIPNERGSGFVQVGDRSLPSVEGHNHYLELGEYQLKSTALLKAVWTGNEEITRMLLDTGANINEPGHAGITPLMVAAGTGSPVLTRLLIDFGADLNLLSNDGNNALTYASMGYSNFICAATPSMETDMLKSLGYDYASFNPDPEVNCEAVLGILGESSGS